MTPQKNKLTQNWRAIIYADKKGYVARKDGAIISPSGKELSLSTLNNIRSQYRQFGVWFEDKTCTLRVHQFVAYQKFGMKAVKADVVRHLDGNSLNNAWKNIGIGTLSENAMDIPREVRLARAKKGGAGRRKKAKGNGRR